MSDKERPLPKPTTRAFGRKNNFENQEEPGSLLADRMAQAAAEGRLDEFLKQEMPDNEYARNLASMMMGMTGMTPGNATGLNSLEKETEALNEKREEAASREVPEDVRQAVMGGDLHGLMGLLRREHQKRNPGSPLPATEEKTRTAPAESLSAQRPAIDKEIIDALVQIASENSVTLDWVILRAIKAYVKEYQRTGKL